jgi:hypothetical protein
MKFKYKDIEINIDAIDLDKLVAKKDVEGTHIYYDGELLVSSPILAINTYHNLNSTILASLIIRELEFRIDDGVNIDKFYQDLVTFNVDGKHIAFHPNSLFLTNSYKEYLKYYQNPNSEFIKEYLRVSLSNKLEVISSKYNKPISNIEELDSKDQFTILSEIRYKKSLLKSRSSNPYTGISMK